jgi:hypothetical protein
MKQIRMSGNRQIEARDHSICDVELGAEIGCIVCARVDDPHGGDGNEARARQFLTEVLLASIKSTITTPTYRFSREPISARCWLFESRRDADHRHTSMRAPELRLL